MALPTAIAPWRLTSRRNVASAYGHTACDLALRQADWPGASMLLAADARPARTGARTLGEMLEWSVLSFDAPAFSGLLARRRNPVSKHVWSAAVRTAVLQKHRCGCSFEYAGYNNPIRQHLVRCDFPGCGKVVCQACAVQCHRHGVNLSPNAAVREVDAATRY